MTRAQSFQAFLKCFSKESFPIALSDDNLPYFSSKNRPLSEELIRRFILQGEKTEEIDEFTEFVPCCIIPDTKDIHAVVYWKGGLMNYEYLLTSYDKNGVVIDRKVIAGTKSDGQHVIQSVATIDQDWVIHIVVGKQSINEKGYDPANSKSMSVELMPNGELLFNMEESI